MLNGIVLWHWIILTGKAGKNSTKEKNGEKFLHQQELEAALASHGTWPHEDFVIDRYKNWTLGCISMKRSDVEELYNYTPVGTKVIIRK